MLQQQVLQQLQPIQHVRPALHSCTALRGARRHMLCGAPSPAHSLYSSACSSTCTQENPSTSGRSAVPEPIRPSLPALHFQARRHSRQHYTSAVVLARTSSNSSSTTSVSPVPQQQATTLSSSSTAHSAEERPRAFALFALPLFISVVALLFAPSAQASGGAMSGQMLDTFKQFLVGVEGLGPWGPVAFLLVVMLCEMVPLFPTQPLSLASGLLFGAVNGAILMLLGVTLAAVNAFIISRGVGRPLAQKVIEFETKGEKEGEGGVTAKMGEVQRAIERGGLWQQVTAITLLRLTPVVPFSASNYLLGLTPVQVPAFLGGTVAGMAVWSVLYASLGGASRKLLDNGADVGALITDLGGKASAMSANVAGYSLLAVGGVVVLYFASSFLKKAPAGSSSMPLAGAESVTSAPGTPNASWQQQQQQQEQQQQQGAQGGQQGQPQGVQGQGTQSPAAQQQAAASSGALSNGEDAQAKQRAGGVAEAGGSASASAGAGAQARAQQQGPKGQQDALQNK